MTQSTNRTNIENGEPTGSSGSRPRRAREPWLVALACAGLGVASVGLAVAGCSSSSGESEKSDTGTGGAKDSGRDGKVDAKEDAKVDAKEDAKADAKEDAKADAKEDAKADASRDSETDAKRDSGDSGDGESESGLDSGLDGDSSQASGTCVLTGSMTTPRSWGPFTGAKLLGNGLVLVAGGVDTSTGHALASAELYNPATGTFSSAGSMSTPRTDLALVTLGNGKVLAAGGTNDQSTSLSSADLYDPVAGTWSLAGGMSIGRSDLNAVALADGRALVFGGWSQVSSLNYSTGVLSYTTNSLNSAEVYDPASNTFQLTGSLTTPRAVAGVSLLPNGNVFTVGGIASPTSPYFTGTAEIYNTTASDGGATGTFTSAGSLPDGVVGYPLAATLKSGKVFILILGGIVGGGSVTAGGPAFLFDPSTNAFTPTASDLIGANNGIGLQSGDVFFVGGTQSGAPTAQTELYQAASGTWLATGNMTTVRSGPALANLPNGDVLVVGGCQKGSCGSSVLASAEICSP
jgi:hypothetical protein